MRAWGDVDEGVQDLSWHPAAAALSPYEVVYFAGHGEPLRTASAESSSAAPDVWPLRELPAGERAVRMLLVLDACHAASAPRGDTSLTAETKIGLEAQAKIDALEEHIRKLEARVSELEERLVADEEDDGEVDDDEVVPLSPHARWIESHLDELRALPDTWVVIDAEKGIVFQTKDEAEFEAQLAKYPPEDRHRLMPLSTRTYT